MFVPVIEASLRCILSDMLCEAQFPVCESLGGTIGGVFSH